jgi:hypothetical protein
MLLYSPSLLFLPYLSSTLFPISALCIPNEKWSPVPHSTAVVAIGAEAKLGEAEAPAVDEEEEEGSEADPPSWGERHSASFSASLLSWAKSLGGIGPNTAAKASLV